MGGFLQTVIFGYGGLRLHAEELIFNGNLPLLPGSTFLYLHGIKYLGAVINFNHSLDSIEIQVESMQSKHQLELVTPEKVLELKSNVPLWLEIKNFLKFKTFLNLNINIIYRRSTGSVS